MLPLLVAAIAVPIVGAFAIAPQLGLAAGALAVAALLVVAARTRFDEPIEVARRGDARYRLLVVANSPLDDPRAVEEVASIATEGARVMSSGDGAPEVLVLAPATEGGLARWASDVGEARARAQRRLALSIAALAAAGLEATGRVTDPDPVLAVEDELATYPAQEVVLLAGPGLEGEQVEEVRRRLDRPVRWLPAHPG
jgi:hypothetical protein